tara:strand:- start:2768 stop:2908 length:141 start_codon:yes stop_codon:yes gene_type:complete
MNLDGYMTVSEYAEKNEITVQAVYQKLKRGNLRSRKIGQLTLVKDL